VLGERIRQARLMAGMSEEALARTAGGLTKQAISKYERGMDVPGSATLLRLCRALNVRPAFLLRPPAARVGTVAFRKAGSLRGKQLHAIEAYTRDAVERWIELEQILRGQDGGSFVCPGTVNWRVGSLEDAERAAQDLRHAWRLGLDPIANVTAVLEGCNVRVIAVEHDGRFSGTSAWVDQRIPVIVLSRAQPGDRQRFTLAHELAHLLLECEEHSDEERAANRFAGAFLLPGPTVERELGRTRNHLSFDELYVLKHRYGVSMACWLKRAADLRIVSPSRGRALWAALRSRGWHTREPGAQVPTEEPSTFHQLVSRALSEGVLSEARAAELAGISLGERRRREGALGPP